MLRFESATAMLLEDGLQSIYNLFIDLPRMENAAAQA